MVTSKNKSSDQYAELSLLFCAGLKGDQLRYAQFLREISQILHRIVGRKLPACDAEDVVQEILISLHKARHTYDGNRPVMPWVLAIASFRMKDHLRKVYAGLRYETLEIETLAEPLIHVTESTSESETFTELLASFPRREQDLLVLMHQEGYTAKEAGRKLGMSESAVKVSLHRAIKKVRETFKQCLHRN